MKTLLLCIVLLLPCTFAEDELAGGHGNDSGRPRDVPAVIYLWCGQNKSLPDAAGIKRKEKRMKTEESKKQESLRHSVSYEEEYYIVLVYVIFSSCDLRSAFTKLYLQDFVAVIDFNPKSSSYGSILKTVSLPAGVTVCTQSPPLSLFTHYSIRL